MSTLHPIADIWLKYICATFHETLCARLPLIQINTSAPMLVKVNKVIWELDLIAVTFHRPYCVRHYPPDAGEYGFGFVRWTLSAIAILIVGSTMYIGYFISSLIHGLV